jgi:hypothetical protein
LLFAPIAIVPETTSEAHQVQGDLLSMLVLSIPVASIAWTVTHEDLFREPREWCVERSRSSSTFVARKAFYLFTCEYCFSHYIAALFLWITGYKLLFTDWRGYLIAGFCLVWVANVYMSAFARLRLDIKEERVKLSIAEGQERRKSAIWKGSRV